MSSCLLPLCLDVDLISPGVTLSFSYDLVKAELMKTSYFEDDVKTHVAASVAAVRTGPPSPSLPSLADSIRTTRSQGTIATTVCSPADVIKSRVSEYSFSPRRPRAILGRSSRTRFRNLDAS